MGTFAPNIGVLAWIAAVLIPRMTWIPNLRPSACTFWATWVKPVPPWDDGHLLGSGRGRPHWSITSWPADHTDAPGSCFRYHKKSTTTYCKGTRQTIFHTKRLKERGTCQNCVVQCICLFLWKTISNWNVCNRWCGSHIFASSSPLVNKHITFPETTCSGHSFSRYQRCLATTSHGCKRVFGYFLSSSLSDCMVASHARPCTRNRNNVWPELHTCSISPQGICSLYYFFLFFYPTQCSSIWETSWHWGVPTQELDLHWSTWSRYLSF